MKSRLPILLATITIVATFAFTYKESKAKKSRDTYFLYLGPDDSILEVTNPQNYQMVFTQPPSTSPFNRLSGLYLNSSLLVYPSGSGSRTGLPKVDVAGTFRTDLLDATDSTKREFYTVNYFIYIKP